MTYNRTSRVAHLDWGRHPTLQCLVPISAFSSPHHHIRLYSTSQKSENAKSRVMFCTSLQLNEPNTRSSRRSIPLLSGIFFFFVSLFFFFFFLVNAHWSPPTSPYPGAQLSSIQSSWAELSRTTDAFQNYLLGAIPALQCIESCIPPYSSRTPYC